MTENASAIESAIQSEMGFRRLVARTLMEVSQLVAELVVSLSNKGQGVTRKRLGPIGELEPQPELDVAKKLVNAGGIDPSGEDPAIIYLADYAKSCTMVRP